MSAQTNSQNVYGGNSGIKSFKEIFFPSYVVILGSSFSSLIAWLPESQIRGGYGAEDEGATSWQRLATSVVQSKGQPTGILQGM